MDPQGIDHDERRPFGAHLAMRWWVPIVLTAVVVAATYGLQLLLGVGAGVVEMRILGKDPDDATLTPVTYLATNLAIVLIAPLAICALAAMARVPWRRVVSVGRGFQWGLLARYALVFVVLLAGANALVQLLQPAPPSAFAISGTTIALLVVVLLTTPLQSAAEELTFRGVLTASYASWVRAARPALLIGIVLSTALFALLHTSTDPWMVLHYLGLGGSTAAMAVIARGLEPAIAFHVVNNVLAMGIGALSSSGGGIGQDRSSGAAGPYMLAFVVAEAIAVLVVWLSERRRARRASRRPD